MIAPPGLRSTCVFLMLLVFCCQVEGAAHPKHKDLSEPFIEFEGDGNYYRVRRQHQRLPIRQQGFSIRQLLPALDEMNRNIRSLEGKLMRHEFRETQVADFTSKTLNALSADHSQTKASVTQIGVQLAAVEERVLAIMTLVGTSDERQRGMMGKLSEGLDRLLMGRHGGLPDLPPDMALALPSTLDQDVKDLEKKMVQLADHQQETMRALSAEVKQVEKSLSQHLTHVSSRQDSMLGMVQTCAENTLQPVSEEPSACEKLGSEVIGRLDLLSHGQQGQDMVLQALKENTQTGFDLQQAELQALAIEIDQEGSYFNNSLTSIVDSLRDFQESSLQDLGSLHSNLKSVMEENDVMIQHKIEAMESAMTEGQNNIMGAIDDTASMTDNLQITVSDNYDLLSKEISGLNKVEQVMINTADAVLDTKRSIEFGIQQIILELSEIVSKSGSTINSTLSDQINAISFNILKNQTSALTNMTQRMEGEISQVWRQIGIMYQQVEQSISMLDNLQDTTDQHMNVSLRRVGNMDGTVGEISGKVNDVEDNLNYLLGRMTLVLSEFNQMKHGIGSELDKLRAMASEVSIPNGDPETLKYNINRKRHIVEDYEHEYN